jgi:hypothetical protein
MDKRETGKSSVIMERKCFGKGLQDLLNKGVHVVEVVTDAHTAIAADISMYTFGSCISVSVYKIIIEY